MFFDVLVSIKVVNHLITNMETEAHMHFVDIVTTLHTRLTHLENQVCLEGMKHDHVFFYEFKMLRALKTFIDEKRWRETQQQARVEKKLNVSFPRIPLHSNVMSVFGTNGPIVEVKSEVEEGDRYGLICVKAKPNEAVFRYVIEYTVNSEAPSSDKQSAKRVPNLESVECRNIEQVVETLESMAFPAH